MQETRSAIQVRRPMRRMRSAAPASEVMAPGGPVREIGAVMDPIRWLPVAAVLALCAGPLLAQLAVLRESELSELIAGGLAGLCLLMLGVAVLVRRRPMELRGGLRPMVVFCAVLTLLHAYAHEDVRPAKYIAFFLLGVGLPVLLSAALDGERAITVVVRCVFAASLPLVLGSLLMPEALYASSNAYYTPARCGWFHNPNTYGTVAFVLSATALTLLSDDTPRLLAMRLGCLGVAGLGTLAIWNSRSRAAALALGAFVLISLAMQLKIRWQLRRSQRAALLAAMLGAVLACGGLLAFIGGDLLASHDVQEFVTKRGRSTDLSSGRLDLWRSAVEEWYRAESTLDALLGHGLGSSTELADVAELGSLHNAYIKALFEVGLIGALVLGAYAVAVLVQSALRALGQGRDAGLFALLVAIVVHSMFEAHLFNLGTTLSSVIFWSALTRLNR